MKSVGRLSGIFSRRLAGESFDQGYDKHSNSDQLERLESEKTTDLNNSLSELKDKKVKPDYLLNHFKACLQLHAENKINYKNVWDLNVLDFLTYTLKQGTNASDLFQIAGSSLDVGMKIYGLRVDELHSHTVNLIVDMDRAAKKKGKENVEDCDVSDAGEKEDGTSPAKKIKAKRRKPVFKLKLAAESALDGCDHLSNLFEFDRNSEKNSSDKCFAYSLLPIPGTFQLSVDPRKSKWVSNKDCVTKHLDLKVLPAEIPDVEDDENLVPSLNSFKIHKWNPEDEEDKTDLNITSNSIAEIIQQHEPDIEGDGEDVYFEAANFEDEYDGNENEPRKTWFAAEMVKVDRMMPNLLFGESSEYAYSADINRDIGFYAGPPQWKLKRLKKRTFSQFVPKKEVGKRGRKRLIKEIDFFTPQNILKVGECKPRSSTVKNLKKITLEWLPPINHAHNLFLRPKIVVSARSKDVDRVTAELELPYDNDNLNDSVYCGDAPDCEEEPDMINGKESKIMEENFAGDNLVEAPTMVPKSTINFATKAKHINMKALKDIIWRSQKKGDRQGFADLVRTVDKTCPSSMKEDISVALIFSALLHLANEHNLSLLYDSNDNNNFIINQ